tara:strand:+ start:300 stop:1067 length:768 start_codon:yes stop_codon:yes gene_type:complete
MGINYDKIKERLDSLNYQGNKDTWKPRDPSENDIRIAPTPDGDPFKDLYFHYNLTRAGILCPKRNFGDDCPICEFASKMWQESQDTGNKELEKLAKNMFVRQRFFSPVIVRGEEDRGVRIWGYGKKVYEKLLSLVLNPDYGDITDMDEGTDLTINYGKKAGENFPNTEIVPRRKASAFCSDMDDTDCANMLENIPDVYGLYEQRSTDEVQAMLDEFLSDDESAESNSTETELGGAGGSTEDKVADAFRELLPEDE